MEKILVTGALGQIGSELTVELRKRYGDSNVVACDLRDDPPDEFREGGPFEQADCTDGAVMERVVSRYDIDTVYHLAAILSGVAEAKPDLAWKVNIDGLYNVLEVARQHDCAVFVPSSIGAFGPSTPRLNTPQETIQRPNTMYGVTKVSGELLCDYYHKRFGVDTRGVRYPGLISHVTPPGGGTTDYAVHIYYEAVKNKRYTCFLREGTKLDMMYMPDAIKAAIDVMEAEPSRLKHRNAFNVTAMSVAPEDIASEIKKHIPEFEIDYKVDRVRQPIADSWPSRLDDSSAREEWEWRPDYDLAAMTKDMLDILGQRYAEGKLD